MTDAEQDAIHVCKEAQRQRAENQSPFQRLLFGLLEPFLSSSIFFVGVLFCCVRSLNIAVASIFIAIIAIGDYIKLSFVRLFCHRFFRCCFATIRIFR